MIHYYYDSNANTHVLIIKEDGIHIIYTKNTEVTWVNYSTIKIDWISLEKKLNEYEIPSDIILDIKQRC